MLNNTLPESFILLNKRSAPGGGFAEQAGMPCGPDTTAWAVIALHSASLDVHLLDSNRKMLLTSQQADGRVALSPEHIESSWPTALCVLAWKDSSKYRDALERAVAFLLRSKGETFKKRPNAIIADDPEIPGWSWNENTFAWVEPTAMALIALKSSGYEGHRRVNEGTSLLLDRQLPSGGWNYGNTVVYGQELLPQPDQTGIALTALAGAVDFEAVEASLAYLQKVTPNLRSPRSLSWAILGLGAWGRRPVQAPNRITECLNLQTRYGPYDTTLLSFLLLSYLAQNETVPFYTKREEISDAR